MNRLAIAALCLAVVLVSVASAARVKRGLTEEAERILRQGSGLDTNNVAELINLVERNKAEECLARVICELAKDPKHHGDAGTKFARSLLRFRDNSHPKIGYYREALAQGLSAKNKEPCQNTYRRCTHSPSEVIFVGNKILKLR